VGDTTLFSIALLAYLAATGLALFYLVQRGEVLARASSLLTQLGWVVHTLSLVIRGIDLGRPPVGNFHEAVSLLVWVAVVLLLWCQRQYQLPVLGAFVLPVVVAFSLSAATLPVQIRAFAPAIRSAWIWVHVTLAMLGIAAFVLNFAGGLMYLIQERQLKSRRPGAFYYRLPSLETLDRLTYRTLTLGFPFLTIGLILGLVSAERTWGTLLAWDPLAAFSLMAWVIYAATLSGRAMAGWRGRRAAYGAIVGFAALLITFGAGWLLPGRHLSF
jgi:cytochrome c-type biogenesis protein CcsB